MENEELIKRIEENQIEPAEEVQGVEEKMIKFIIFLIDQKRYALYAEDVREIILDYPMFYIPFVPPYVRGFINRHGEPHTVIDLNVLFEQVKLESSTFMVLARNNDQLALVITEICEIVKVPESDVHLIMGDRGEDDFFLGSVSIHDQEIFIANLDSVLERLDRDVTAS